MTCVNRKNDLDVKLYYPVWNSQHNLIPYLIRTFLLLPSTPIYAIYPSEELAVLGQETNNLEPSFNSIHFMALQTYSGELVTETENLIVSIFNASPYFWFITPVIKFLRNVYKKLHFLWIPTLRVEEFFQMPRKDTLVFNRKRKISIQKVFLGFMVLYILVWNIGIAYENPMGIGIHGSFRSIAYFFGIDQYWKMFSPGNHFVH